MTRERTPAELVADAHRHAEDEARDRLGYQLGRRLSEPAQVERVDVLEPDVEEED